MAVPLGKPGINKAAELPWLDLPPGMGGANPITASRHSYLGTVVLQPGDAFPFHRHPNQTEAIYLAEGRVEGWYEKHRADLKPGDVIIAPADSVHAVYNTSEAAVVLLVMLYPLVETSDEDWELAPGYGWEMVDVSDQAPWNEMR